MELYLLCTDDLFGPKVEGGFCSASVDLPGVFSAFVFHLLQP